MELDFDGNVRDDRPAILHRRLISVILHSFQSWPAQRRRPGQHGRGSDVPIRVDNSVDHHASGLEVSQILQRGNGAL